MAYKARKKGTGSRPGLNLRNRQFGLRAMCLSPLFRPHRKRDPLEVDGSKGELTSTEARTYPMRPGHSSPPTLEKPFASVTNHTTVRRF
jgi:hypothetical protein